MTLSVRFVGSGDAFGSGGRLQACILLDSLDGKLLLDCGTSSLIGMKRFGLDPGEVGFVILTHLHGDHFAGLPFMIIDGHFSHRDLPLVIAGPSGTQTRVLAAMEVLFPGSTSVERRFSVEFVELTPAVPTAIGPAMVTAFEVVHASGAPAFALRVALEGRLVAYSGDTSWSPSLVDAARGADLFICEAYFHDRQVPFHLDYRTVLAHADELDCRRIVLAHMTQDMLEREGIAFERASDGLEIGL